MLIRTRCFVGWTIAWAALFCAACCLFLSAEANASESEAGTGSDLFGRSNLVAWGKSTDYWAVEDAAAREKLPLYQVIPAAKPAELTRANGFPKGRTFLTWERSHGDNGGMRYSALRQINRGNITNVEAAWVYHSHDTGSALECNPIIVRDMMFTPTPGDAVVAVNAATGTELWRFKPEGRPAFRGLIYWPGGGRAKERVMFCAGKFLYALDPKSGWLIADFGEGGKVLLPGVAQPGFGAATAAPVIFQKIIIVAGFEKDVWGFDVTSGRLLWTFHTVPQPGEFGSDTWDKPEAYAANAWAGIALDEKRGIAFITTASPKPNFNGVRHRGQNLFANCVIALDAGTGKRLWHFQEIRHDIWDLDISAPPNLATITREGRRVDVVTATTKIGNTLLLDRTSGKPIFPFRLRRAPTSDVAGEQTWPYQPDPELPENFSKLEFTAADLTTRTPEAAARRPPRAQNSRSKTLRDIVRLLPRDQSFGDRPVSAVARVAASVERGGDHPTNSRGKERDAGKPATERGGLEGAGGFSSSARPPGGGGGG